MVSRLYLTFLLGALASLVVALPRPLPQATPAQSDPTAGRSRECGVQVSSQRHREGERLFKTHRIAPVAENATATLDIHFHVVYANETMEGGYLSDQRIYDQLGVMNRDYNSTGIQWNLRSISRIQSPEWFLNISPSSTGELAMKGVYRRGGKADLNVYTVGFANPDAAELLGIATFPMDYTSAPQLDGVMLLHSTLPGSQSRQYSLGRTLVHEAGHWVGLYHTFEGGCEAPGDEVEDTPFEAIPSKGCPLDRKTCPGTPGLDPVRNFMDYSDDSCMDNFTPGQAQRIQNQLVAYRGVKYV
jgi:hypothetical protein